MAAYAAKQPTRSRDLAAQTVMFAIGSSIIHSAACVINDICDRDFDRQVERTRNRPLAAGMISLLGAWILLFVLICASFTMLFFANHTAAFYGIPGIFPFHALYPLMKRWTWWPQAWLGFAMNWGFLVAWMSVLPDSDNMRVPIIMLFGLICWTILYDTIYACQDRKDDIKAGVKSTALLFGDRVRPILAAFGTTFVACLIVAGILNKQGPAFFAVSCGGAAIHISWQLITWRVDDPQDSGAKFKLPYV
ncbi:hypothetical protein EW146_g8340 [Bondarzewia mesenterica]|uniref:4-hydroxybenzoate polyprenyltransferase, mitochondrial n=1 Tax=Bondarzewia mesenterica TaxID=1095465 RepID=A0A4S4LF75_9AGAM|nr:hypothetical protein EW146_g8340 [Bondarzewia mesenterica]